MSYKCTFHEEVAYDYMEAYTWYEKQKAGLGERFLAAIRKKLEQVTKHPEAYGQKTKKNYREAKIDIFPYYIVYKIYK